MPSNALDVSSPRATPTDAHAHELVRRLGGPLLGGNRVRLLSESAAWDAMQEALATATDHVNLEIDLADSAGPGDALAQGLVARCRAGVRVNLLVDDLGAMREAPGLLDGLRHVGASLCEFTPLQRWWARVGRALGRRARNSFMIVDGRIGFLGVTPSSVAFDPRSPGDAWHLVVEGPAVQRLQRLFIAHWQHRASSPMQQARYFPALAQAGRQRVGLTPSAEISTGSARESALLGAIVTARRDIVVSTTRPLPPEVLLALTHAARRGVDVELLRRGDGALAGATAAALRAAGVRINETRSPTPGCVIDGVWASVGECATQRPMAWHDGHAAVIVIDEGFARVLAQAMHQDAHAASGVDAEPLGGTSWSRWLVRRFRPYG